MSYTYVFLDDYFDKLNDSVNLKNQTLSIDPETLVCKFKPLEPAINLALALVLSAIFLLAIPGNVLVAWVIGASRQTLVPSELYLLHLTVADGLMALTLPFWAVALVRGWVFGDFLCKLLNLIIEANFYTSIIFLACISVDRYQAIVRASTALGAGRGQVLSRSLCAAVWVVGAALGLPALFYDVQEEDGVTLCSESFELGRASYWRLVTRGFRHVFGFLLPLGVMVACYGITVLRLLRSRGFRKHRAMRVMIAVVVSFLLCWIPYHVTMMADTLIRADVVPFDCATRASVSLALVASNCLALLHSCVNPVLYAFVGERFRDKMVLLLRQRLRRERAPQAKLRKSTSQTSEGNGAIF